MTLIALVLVLGLGGAAVMMSGSDGGGGGKSGGGSSFSSGGGSSVSSGSEALKTAPKPIEHKPTVSTVAVNSISKILDDKSKVGNTKEEKLYNYINNNVSKAITTSEGLLGELKAFSTDDNKRKERDDLLAEIIKGLKKIDDKKIVSVDTTNELQDIIGKLTKIIKKKPSEIKKDDYEKELKNVKDGLKKVNTAMLKKRDELRITIEDDKLRKEQERKEKEKEKRDAEIIKQAVEDERKRKIEEERQKKELEDKKKKQEEDLKKKKALEEIKKKEQEKLQKKIEAERLQKEREDKKKAQDILNILNKKKAEAVAKKEEEKLKKKKALEEKKKKELDEKKKQEEEFERKMDSILEVEAKPYSDNFHSKHVPGSSAGFTVDWNNLTFVEYQNFINLCRSNPEFNTYAGQLLVSLWDCARANLKDVMYSANYPKGLKTLAESNMVWLAHLFDLIARYLGLLPQEQIYKGSDYYFALFSYGIYRQNFGICGYGDDGFKQLLYHCIRSDSFITLNESAYYNKSFSLHEIIYKLVKGTLTFWQFKNNRKYENYTGKVPMNINNGGLYCWFQSGYQLINAATVNDNPYCLGNWKRFCEYAYEEYKNARKNHARETKRIDLLKNRDVNIMTDKGIFKGIELKGLLDNFFASCYKDTESFRAILEGLPEGQDYAGTRKFLECCINNKVEENVIEEALTYLNNSQHSGNGSEASNAMEKFFLLFPELSVKRDNKELLIENPKDQNLWVYADVVVPNNEQPRKDYCLSYASVKNLVPNLDSSAPGVGSYGNNEQGIQIFNKYAEYKIGWSDNKLLVYELRGIGLCEGKALGVKYVPLANKYCYTVAASTHQRAVVKLDNSTTWHYCDSNGIYHSANSLQDLLNDKRSYMNYNYTEIVPNYANLLMYHLVDENIWAKTMGQ